MLVMPSVGERVDDRVHHRRRRRDRTRLPHSLHAHRIRRARRLGAVELPARELRGRRNEIADHVPGQQVAVLVVDRLLVERLRDALREPAVDLPLDDDRVHDRADVVDGDVAQQLDGAGLGVDLDDRDVRARRPREVRRVVHVRLLEARLETLGQVVRRPRRERHLLQRHRRLRPAGTCRARARPAPRRPPAGARRSSSPSRRSSRPRSRARRRRRRGCGCRRCPSRAGRPRCRRAAPRPRRSRSRAGRRRSATTTSRAPARAASSRSAPARFPSAGSGSSPPPSRRPNSGSRRGSPTARARTSRRTSRARCRAASGRPPRAARCCSARTVS